MYPLVKCYTIYTLLLIKVHSATNNKNIMNGGLEKNKSICFVQQEGHG